MTNYIPDNFKEILSEIRQASSTDYIVVDTLEKAKALVQYVEDHDILAFDIEADSLNVRQGTIIGFSLCGKAGVSYYLPTKVHQDGQLQDFILDQQQGIKGDGLAKIVLDKLKDKKLITHNGSYDLRMVYHYYGVNLLDSLWVETLLALHSVMEEGVPGTPTPFALKSIAVHFKDQLGIDPEKAANEEQIELKRNIKENGGEVSKTNFEIWKADLPILAKYGAADTDLTYRIAFILLEKIIQEQLVEFFFKEEVMPLYKLVTVPMELRGVALDLAKMRTMHSEVEDTQVQLEQEVIESLTQTNQFRAWCVHNATTEFPPSTRGSYAATYCEMYNVQLPTTKSGKASTTTKVLQGLPDGIDKQFLLGQHDQLDLKDPRFVAVSLQLWKRSNDGKLINIKSKQQLTQLVFEFFNEKPISQTKKGTPQFDEDVIELLSPKYPWCTALRKYNKLQKIKSAYIERFLEGQEQGRYYFYFKQHGTVSGRYGSDAQQLPRPLEEGDDDPMIVHYVNQIRTFFIADQGRSFIDCDYESLEPHVFAHVSGDDKLKDVFRKGHDFYSTIAINAENLHHLSADKNAENYLKKVDPSKRQRAKPYALGIPYGMKEFRLAQTLNISKQEAKTIIDNYLTNFAQLAKWMTDSDNFVKQNGYIRTEVGRIRHLPVVKQVYTNLQDKLFDFKFRMQLSNQYGKDRVGKLFYNYTNGLNNSHNFQIQSLAASIVNRAAVAATKKFAELGIDGWVCAQIHDQLIFDVADKDVHRAAEVVQQCMENTTKLSLALKAPPAIAKNWKEGH